MATETQRRKEKLATNFTNYTKTRRRSIAARPLPLNPPAPLPLDSSLKGRVVPESDYA